MFMRMLPYLWHSAWRSKRRSIIAILGVAVGIFVFLALQSAILAVKAPARKAGSERLLNVRESARSSVMASRLPQGYETKVGMVDGVEIATGVLSDIAVIGEKGVHVFVDGIDPDKFLSVRKVTVASQQWTEFRNGRNTAIVGWRLIKSMGWNVGDNVEIRELRLRTRIVGVVPPQDVDMGDHMLVHRDYIQNTRKAEGQVSYILVLVSESDDPLSVAKAIDAQMAVSPVPTKTVSAAAYAQAIIKDFMGFIDYLGVVGWIVIAVIVLGIANAVGISVRERAREIGILKAIGIPPRVVMSLIVSESVLLAVIGGLLGMAAAWGVITSAGSMAGLQLNLTTMAIGVFLALICGVLGAIPAVIPAVRIPVIEALRTID